MEILPFRTQLGESPVWDARSRALWFVDAHAPASGKLEHFADVGPDAPEGNRLTGGAATEVEGFCWSAGVSAGCLNRWSPDGELVRRVALPMPNPTMPCFAGDDMKTVYVTSLVRDPDANAGCTVRLELGVAGVPVARFPLRASGGCAARRASGRAARSTSGSG